MSTNGHSSGDLRFNSEALYVLDLVFNLPFVVSVNTLASQAVFVHNSNSALSRSLYMMVIVHCNMYTCADFLKANSKIATVYSSSVNRRGELSAGKLASTVWREANEPKEGLAADPTL